MKILLGNNTLDILAGSETWVLTMAKEFVRLGHDVTAFSDRLGFIATKLEEIGVRCISTIGNESAVEPYDFVLREVLDDEFDVIICAHHHITASLRRAFPDTPIIATIHGILHKDQNTGKIFPEHPNMDINVDAFVAVSDEVNKMLQDQYNVDSRIIRNPIDLDRFKHDDQFTDVKSILINSNYTGKDDQITAIIKEVSDILDAELGAIGVNFQPTYHVEEFIQKSEMVVGMGRSVLEGLATGRVCLVHGRWGTGGVITPKNVEKLSWFNFSGRNSNGVFMSAQEIVTAIREYMDNKEQYTRELRDYVEVNHSVKRVAQKYLSLADELIQKKNAF